MSNIYDDARRKAKKEYQEGQRFVALFCGFLLILIGFPRLLPSCASNIEYKPGIQKVQSVYTKIVSIVPVYAVEKNNSGIICSCKTENGGSVLVYMTKKQYIKYFDSEINFEDEFDLIPEKQLSPALMLHGKTKKISDLEHAGYMPGGGWEYVMVLGRAGKF